MSGHSIDSYVYKYMYIYIYIYIFIHTHHLNTLEKCVLVLEMQYDSKNISDLYPPTMCDWKRVAMESLNDQVLCEGNQALS